MVGKDSWIAVYITASARNGTLYVGVTSTLPARVQQHKLGIFVGFSKTYGCKVLVWYETHATMLEAIRREKQIKRWRRDWKLASSRPKTRSGAICPTDGSKRLRARFRGCNDSSSQLLGWSCWVPDLRALRALRPG
jgi:putative endonuclease